MPSSKAFPATRETYDGPRPPLRRGPSDPFVLAGRAGRPGTDVGEVGAERHALHQRHRLRLAEAADEDLGRCGAVLQQPQAGRTVGAPLRPGTVDGVGGVELVEVVRDPLRL